MAVEVCRPVPSLCRAVLYYRLGSSEGTFDVAEPAAAVVTTVYEEGNPESPVGLAIFNPNGMYFNQAVLYGPGEPGRWGWPPFVAPVKETRDA